MSYKLDDYEMRPGRRMGVSISLCNQRLFVSNIPKNKDKDDLHQEFAKHSPGLVDVIIYNSPDDRKKNRGFCFLEYENHKAAAMAKRKLSSGQVKVWNCDIIVDWADPLEEPDEETMSKVKVLYVRNLTMVVTEDELKAAFANYGHVERVKKIKDYAFVHFTDRENALRALSALHGVELGGAPMEVTLAKPPSDKRKKEEILRKREMRMTHLMYNRGKFWNSSLYGNSFPGAPRGARSVTSGRLNGHHDFGPGASRSAQMLGGGGPGFGYASGSASSDYLGVGSSMSAGMGQPPRALAGASNGPRREMTYAELLNAADFWDDFNDLDMSCSPLAPAAVPIPAMGGGHFGGGGGGGPAGTVTFDYRALVQYAVAEEDAAGAARSRQQRRYRSMNYQQVTSHQPSAPPMPSSQLLYPPVVGYRAGGGGGGFMGERCVSGEAAQDQQQEQENSGGGRDEGAVDGQQQPSVPPNSPQSGAHQYFQ